MGLLMIDQLHHLVSYQELSMIESEKQMFKFYKNFLKKVLTNIIKYHFK